jgi:hypothetical protein
LGIKVWRFYLKCPTCLAEVSFKTDPKRNDYTVERGASRNFEPWKTSSAEEKLETAKKAREEAGDSMKVLENRTEASKREMELQDAIEEVKELNARAQALTTDQIIDIHAGAAARWEEAQIEQMAAEAFARKQQQNGRSAAAATNAAGSIRSAAAGDAADAGVSSAAAPASSSSSSSVLPVVKRLPDAVDLAASDFRPLNGGAATLDQLEVPDSPTADGADGTCGPEPTSGTGNGSGTAGTAASFGAVNGFAGLSSPPAAATAAGPAAPAAAGAPAPLLGGLVLIKKRKADSNNDPEREKKKQAKREKKAAEKAAVAAAASAGAGSGASAPSAAPSGGLSLLGNYADDSD